MTASYLTLARRRPARRLLYALASATLSFGMLSLTVLLTVERSTGSYRAAGYAVAAFALAASATAPLRGRLVDRSGARIWLPALASGYATALVALDVAAHAGAPEWALVLFAGASGFSAPPIFASARALWPHVVEIELVRRGYAMTSLFYDAGQIAGPIVASLTFLVSTWAAAIVCGAFALMGALLSLPAHYDRLTLERRIVEFFHGNEEGIHVDVEDGAGETWLMRDGHAAGILAALAAPLVPSILENETAITVRIRPMPGGAIRITSRIVFCVCGLISLLTAVPYAMLRGADLPTQSEWVIFVAALAVIGFFDVTVSLLPRAWIARVCGIDRDDERLFALPLKVLVSFAAVSYLVAVFAHFAPQTWRLNPRLMA